MTLPTVGNVNYPTPDELREMILADQRRGYIKAGLPINAAKGTELRIRAEAVANRIAIPIANNKITLRNRSPQEAEGDELEALAADYGVERRPASKAAGLVIVRLSIVGSLTIPKGFACTSASGIQYETTASVTVADTLFPPHPTVAVQSLTGGEIGNLDADEIVTWDSAALGVLIQTATVAPGGIADGFDEDDDNALRKRLQRRLQFPESGGNAAQVATQAENASSAVEVAFVYPSVRGPGSYDVAVVSNDSDRVVGGTTVNLIGAELLAENPGFADLVTTTVNLQEVDAIVDFDLPLPVNAGGAGGGWRDESPWPSDAEAVANKYAEITATSLATRQITVNSSSDPPVVGKRFGVWNPSGGDDGVGKMHEFTITAVGGGLGAYVITIDASSDSIEFIETGMYCSAGAHNLVAYAEALRAAMRGLGPGEKTDNADILPRGRRTPGPDTVFPTDISSLLLSEVSNAFAEVQDADYAAVIATGTGDAGTALFTARTSPTVTATTADPPNLLTIANMSFRRKV